ncbi:hypothetical protein LCGC14_2440280 [marine sediment metagenome]|uniref:LysM domain-containing protein n=1 Tax=marine sediment metagenome TaxID=412755 RepID=A0A0F9BJB6_9ZZZZ
MSETILALDCSEWQGKLDRQKFQYAYDVGVRLYIAQLFGSGPTGLGTNDYADEQLGFAKDVGMALAGYIWVPPDDTTKTESLVEASLTAAGVYRDELRFVAPDLEGGRLHPTNPVGRLMNVCQNLTLANKNIVIYNRKNNWPVVMGAGVTDFKQWPLWEARYYFKSGFKPNTPPDIDWKWAKYGGWKQRAILQYAGTAPVNGWGADWNVVAVDRLGFDLFVDTPTPPKPPAPKPKPKEEGMSSKEFQQLDTRLKSIQTELKSHARSYHPDGPIKPQPSPRKYRDYIVVPGDSLSLIAKKLGVNAGRYTEMAALNGITHPFIIHPGQVLKIPMTW